MGAPVSPQEIHPEKGRRFINPINIPIHLCFSKFRDQMVALSRKWKLSSRKTCGHSVKDLGVWDEDRGGRGKVAPHWALEFAPKGSVCGPHSASQPNSSNPSAVTEHFCHLPGPA